MRPFTNVLVLGSDDNLPALWNTYPSAAASCRIREGSSVNLEVAGFNSFLQIFQDLLRLWAESGNPDHKGSAS